MENDFVKTGQRDIETVRRLHDSSSEHVTRNEVLRLKEVVTDLVPGNAEGSRGAKLYRDASGVHGML